MQIKFIIGDDVSRKNHILLFVHGCHVWSIRQKLQDLFILKFINVIYWKIYWFYAVYRYAMPMPTSCVIHLCLYGSNKSICLKHYIFSQDNSIPFYVTPFLHMGGYKSGLKLLDR